MFNRNEEVVVFGKPATVIRTSPIRRTVTVRFEDGTEATVDYSRVKRG